MNALNRMQRYMEEVNAAVAKAKQSAACAQLVQDLDEAFNARDDAKTEALLDAAERFVLIAAYTVIMTRETDRLKKDQPRSDWNRILQEDFQDPNSAASWCFQHMSARLVEAFDPDRH